MAKTATQTLKSQKSSAQVSDETIKDMVKQLLPSYSEKIADAVVKVLTSQDRYLQSTLALTVLKQIANAQGKTATSVQKEIVMKYITIAVLELARELLNNHLSDIVSDIESVIPSGDSIA